MKNKPTTETGSGVLLFFALYLVFFMIHGLFLIHGPWQYFTARPYTKQNFFALYANPGINRNIDIT